MSVVDVVDVRVVSEHGHRYLEILFANGHVYDPEIPNNPAGLWELLQHIGRKTWCTPEIAARLADVCAETTEERQCHEV